MSLSIWKRFKKAFTKEIIVTKTIEIDYIPCKVIQLCHCDNGKKDMIVENQLTGEFIELKDCPEWNVPGTKFFLKHEKIV